MATLITPSRPNSDRADLRPLEEKDGRLVRRRTSESFGLDDKSSIRQIIDGKAGVEQTRCARAASQQVLSSSIS